MAEIKKEHKKILERSAKMMENDSHLVKHYEKIDKMINLEWQLPDKIKDLKWMRKVISTDPQSALKTAIRTLSTIEPVPSYQPTNPHDETKQNASNIEMNLLWQLRQADKRSRKKLVADIVESALRYDKVCVQTIPLKWQIEAQGEFEGEMPTRYKAAQNLGGFMVEVHNPKDVHDRWTPLGLDAVLLAKVMESREAVAFYGEAASELAEELEDEDNETWVTVFDYWDYDRRLVTCSAPTENRHKESPESSEYVFVDSEESEEDFDMAFLGGWTVVEGGTSLEADKTNSVRPMLGTIAKSDMWDTQNIAQSLSFSESISYAAAPRGIIKSPNADEVRIDYGDINRPVRLKPGEDYEQLTPPAIDQNLLHISDRIQAAIDKDTVAKSLQNLDFPSGTAFATVNAVIKSATAALDPYKSLAEKAIAGIFENMLRWTAYTKEPMRGFGYHKQDEGTQYTLKPEFIDTSNIYIRVKLSAHVPTDYLQRIEAAIAMKDQLDFPKEDAYKHLDVPNPDQVMEKRWQERLEEHEMQLRMQRRQAQNELAIQQQQMAMQMQMQQAAQQQQANLQGRMQQRGTPRQGSVMRGTRQQLGQQPQGRTGVPRREAIAAAVSRNPARTGVSPNQSNPQGNLRERRTGRARGGEEIQ